MGGRVSVGTSPAVSTGHTLPNASFPGGPRAGQACHVACEPGFLPTEVPPEREVPAPRSVTGVSRRSHRIICSMLLRNTDSACHQHV